MIYADKEIEKQYKENTRARSTIIYDYYPIECKLSTNTSSSIETMYLGQPNRPNIVYIDQQKKKTLYHTDHLTLVKAIHNIPTSDGEILISHKSLTSSKRLLCYFPFMYNPHGKETDIDQWINSSTTIQFYTNIYIDMSTHIASTDSTIVQEYTSFDKQGQECHILVFNEIIHIATDIRKKIQQLQSHSSEILHLQSLEKKLNSPANIIRKNTIIQEGLTTSNKENEDDNVIYSCEYLPVDSDETIQVLQVPINQNSIIDPVMDTKISTVFIYNSIIIFCLIKTFLVSPVLYEFITFTIRGTPYNSFLLDALPYITSMKVTILGIIIISILTCLSLSLLLYGFIVGNRISTSIGMFLPFFTIFSYISINTTRRVF
jgi:hypothetical protein